MFRNIFLSLIPLGIGIIAFNSLRSELNFKQMTPPVVQTFWEYQCIDTMKYSRDRARQFGIGKITQTTVAFQVKKIADLGANCIAIGTPYDDEFLPYLKIWVQEARKNTLHVWFRGNWSGYERWFDYPQLANLEEHHTKTAAFIANNPGLFEDGDIFTPAPEPENSSVFRSLYEKDPELFRSFILTSNRNALESFQKIHKNVHTEFTSLSGGVARQLLDKATIDALNKTVTLDHYVRSPDVMGEYIDYFHSSFGAKVALGEFGAPIPDINTNMADKDQAPFVDSLFQVLAEKHLVIPAINYWTLSDSSTAILDDRLQEKPVAGVIRKYYRPVVVYGIVEDVFGNAVTGARIIDSSRHFETLSDMSGKYSLILPQRDSVTLRITVTGFREQPVNVRFTSARVQKLRIRLW